MSIVARLTLILSCVSRLGKTHPWCTLKNIHWFCTAIQQPIPYFTLVFRFVWVLR